MGLSVGGLVSGIDPKIVDKLMEVERVPINNLEKRKESVKEQVKGVNELREKMKALEKSIDEISTKGKFLHLKLESSHPDIVDGNVGEGAIPGVYEFDIKTVAKNEKELAYGFVDKDKTPVGFGWLLLNNEDTQEDMVIKIEPESTLQDVASSINDAEMGMKAIVINTGMEDDPYRLLVINESSGKKAKIEIDPDTTYLEFKEQVTGRNCELLFEDVPVTWPRNNLEDLIPGVVFDVHRAEAGTKVTVNINWDIDATLEGIMEFVKQYNEVNNFINNQYVIDEETKKAGIMAADSGLKQIRRVLRNEISKTFTNLSHKYRTLATIGIKTNSKDGSLIADKDKIKHSLSEDILGVASLFIVQKENPGLAPRMKDKLTQLRDREYGVLENRKKGLQKVIENIDSQIERKERRLTSVHENLKKKFAALETTMSTLNQQGSFLAQKFGTPNVQTNPQLRES